MGRQQEAITKQDVKAMRLELFGGDRKEDKKCKSKECRGLVNRMTSFRTSGYCLKCWEKMKKQ